LSPAVQVREYLMDFNGLSGKSVACLLLYRMGRVDFAVDVSHMQHSPFC
jgi:3-methyladenine DNA glycosylase/8-oxoguanine DNA glycosylase